MAAPLFETTVKFGRSMMKLVYRSAPHLIGVGGKSYLGGGCSPHLKMLVFRAYLYIFGLLPCSEQHMLVLFEHGKSPKIYKYTLKTASALALKMGSIPETLKLLRGGCSPHLKMYVFLACSLYLWTLPYSERHMLVLS